MTNLHDIYPGMFFIFRREKPTSAWDLLYRDDSRSTMDCRFAYQKEHLPKGAALRYEDPKGHLIEEVGA